MTFSARDYAVGLLLQESERDKQVHIGASNISNPCARCLGRDLIGDRTGTDIRAFLGGKLGSATHLFLEELQRPLEEAGIVLIEKKLEWRELPGYGMIKMKPDCAHLEAKTLIDWKSSLRDKSKAMQQFLNMPVSRPYTDKGKLLAGELKIKAYIAQTQIYADALVADGEQIDKIAVCFLNRDGTGWFDHPNYDEYYDPNKQRDIWEFQVDRDPAYADKLWDRLVSIWDTVQEGHPIEDLETTPGCYRCDFIDAMEAK